LGSVACGFSYSLEWLITARAIQGLGGAMMVPVGRLVLLRTVPKNELVNALAYLTIPALIGPLIGPPLGGFITTYFHWRWIFWINIPVGLLGLALVTAFMPEIKIKDVPPLDFRGFVLSGAGLASLVFGATVLGRDILSSYGPPLMIAAGVLLLIAYVLHAQRAANPILDLKLFRIETYRSGVIGGSLFRIGAGALPFLLPLMLQIGFGLTPFQSGTLTCATAAGALAMKFSAGRILKAFGFRTVLLLNGALSSAALAAIGLFEPHMSFLVIVTVLLIGGFVRSLQFTALNAIAYADVSSEAMGRATSLYGVAQQLSLATGVAVAAFALEGARAWRGDPTLVPADFAIAFVTVAMIGALSLLSYRRLDAHAGASVSGRIAG
jgi:EmrB/QacA subfamily drug resistance transporter